MTLLCDIAFLEKTLTLAEKHEVVTAERKQEVLQQVRTGEVDVKHSIDDWSAELYLNAWNSWGARQDWKDLLITEGDSVNANVLKDTSMDDPLLVKLLDLVRKCHLANAKRSQQVLMNVRSGLFENQFYVDLWSQRVRDRSSKAASALEGLQSGNRASFSSVEEVRLDDFSHDVFKTFVKAPAIMAAIAWSTALLDVGKFQRWAPWISCAVPGFSAALGYSVAWFSASRVSNLLNPMTLKYLWMFVVEGVAIFAYDAAHVGAVAILDAFNSSELWKISLLKAIYGLILFAMGVAWLSLIHRRHSSRVLADGGEQPKELMSVVEMEVCSLCPGWTLFDAFNVLFLGPTWEDTLSFPGGFLAVGYFFTSFIAFSVAKFFAACFGDSRYYYGRYGNWPQFIAAKNAVSIYFGLCMHQLVRLLINMWLGDTKAIGISWLIYPVCTLLLAAGQAKQALELSREAAGTDDEFSCWYMAPEMELTACAFWVSLAWTDFLDGALAALKLNSVVRAGIVTVCWVTPGIFLTRLYERCLEGNVRDRELSVELTSSNP